ncbi:flagellar protein FlaG [Paenibacillus sp. JX-17]|uniref:Flagellar protein FlaG n=1 Tax=Paenibacillus lacisoli TaxID=3064525 RepID=A0ABT9CBC9_9BACL|nr:flagellar protein FlaG [Paenibacillus sp. JX-17]MDO7906569.1 flagellar protein FlaG [Paenibacillus sp. JX-17]
MDPHISISTRVSGSLDTGNTPVDDRSTGQEVDSVGEMKRVEYQEGPLPVGEEQFIRRVEQAMKALAGPETTLDISIHKPTNSIMVKVLNKDTGEVIREVPPEKTLDIVAKMMEIAGIIIDKKV